LPVSEATAPPFVLDTSVVTGVARGDPDIIALLQGYDARGQLLVIPALAIAGASLDARSEEADDLLGSLELLENVTIAPLRGTEQAARLADIIAKTGLDPWDAHATAIADVEIYRSSPSTPVNGGSSQQTLMSLCTSSKSPTRTKASPWGYRRAIRNVSPPRRYCSLRVGNPSSPG
jgi:hypothetical protein